ncbi:MAG TPA: CRISPR system precrRNA processing endoribonuclease RAMP protein Cas6 [Desulfuromonadaceae bacterium]
MEFNFLKVVLTLELKADIADPYLLFEIRRDFAEAFRRAVGCRRPQCTPCENAAECPYRQVFSQDMLSDPTVLRRFQKPPLPFVFDLPLLPSAPNSGEQCEIGLVLAGIAANYVRHFLAAVTALVEGPASPLSRLFSLEMMETCDHSGNRQLIARRGEKPLLDRFFIIAMDDLAKEPDIPAHEVKLTFITPLRIIKDGHPLRELTFSSLAMALLRRMSAIAFYYCYLDLDLEYKLLSMQSREIGISARGLKWIDWGKNLGGIMGSATFTGNLADFHSLLLFGQYFHAGKGSAYGLGRYRLG